MNIYTHPEIIKNLASKVNSKSLKAYKGSYNYHVIDGVILEYWQQGTGMYPEVIKEIPKDAKFI